MGHPGKHHPMGGLHSSGKTSSKGQPRRVRKQQKAVKFILNFEAEVAKAMAILDKLAGFPQQSLSVAERAAFTRAGRPLPPPEVVEALVEKAPVQAPAARTHRRRPTVRESRNNGSSRQ